MGLRYDEHPAEGAPLASDLAIMLQSEEYVGRFVIRAKLAQGGSSEVYFAVEAGQEDEAVALKILRKDRQGDTALELRMLNEAQLLSYIRDPGVVKLVDSGIHTDGRPYLACELLTASLAEAGPLAAPRAVALVAKLARTLAGLHAQDIVHRDVKPQNILLTRDGLPKLVDFGLAKLPPAQAISEGRFLRLSTDSEIFFGTYGYAAPEQLVSAKDVDDRADVYSLGVVLFELLARRRPFVAAERGRLISLQLNEPAPRLSALVPNLPAQLVALVARMLAKDPADRPDASQVAMELSSVRFKPPHPARGWLRALPILAVSLLPAPAAERMALDALLEQRYKRFEVALFSSTVDEAESELQAAARDLHERGASSPMQWARQRYKEAALAKERGHLRSAMQLFTKAQTSLRGLVRAQPAQAFKALSICADGIGEMSYHSGEYAQALRSYAEAAHTLPRTLAVAVSNRQVPAFLDYQRALVLRDQGAMPAALDALLDAEGHERTLLAQPEAALADHWQLARVLSLRASILAQTGELADAWAAAREAETQAQAALAKQPGEKRFRLAHLQALQSLGDIATRRGQDGAAYDRQALDGLAALVKSDPGNGQWAHAFVEALVQAAGRSEGELRRQRARAALQQIAQLAARRQWQDDVHIRGYQASTTTLGRP